MNNQRIEGRELADVVEAAASHAHKESPVTACKVHVLKNLLKGGMFSAQDYYGLVKGATVAEKLPHETGELILEDFCSKYIAEVNPPEFKQDVAEIFYEEHPGARKFNGSLQPTYQ